MLRKPIPKKIREQVYKKYNGHCAYCGCGMAFKNPNKEEKKAIQKQMKELGWI